MHNEMNAVSDQPVHDAPSSTQAVKHAGGTESSNHNAVQQLTAHLSRDHIVRLALLFLDNMPDVHLKDLRVDELDDQRRMRVGEHSLLNFGSDSFLGLDWHPAVQRVLIEATAPLGHAQRRVAGVLQRQPV